MLSVLSISLDDLVPWLEDVQSSEYSPFQPYFSLAGTCGFVSCGEGTAY